MKKICIVVVLFSFLLAGCGETISGMTKDVRRWGKGSKTVVFRED